MGLFGKGKSTKNTTKKKAAPESDTDKITPKRTPEKPKGAPEVKKPVQTEFKPFEEIAANTNSSKEANTSPELPLSTKDTADKKPALTAPDTQPQDHKPMAAIPIYKEPAPATSSGLMAIADVIKDAVKNSRRHLHQDEVHGLITRWYPSINANVVGNKVTLSSGKEQYTFDV